MQFIDLKAQYATIKNDVLAEITQVLDSGQYIMGAKVNELEQKLAQYTGSNHCIGVADGTKALLIALMALGLSTGDEVIVPDFTFIATASMAVLLGLKPVFVDVDPHTYNLDPNAVEAAITPKTKAIIAVSLFGQCADFDAINSIAAKHNIPVIEDAAQSFGATYKGKHSGNLTTIATSSFFPSKPLGCYGDGGACFTNDDSLAEKMRQIRVHGQDKRYHHALLGVNGRLDTIQAAVLLVKLKIFDREVEARKRIGARYSELLQQVCCVPKIPESNTHVYAQYTILVENRDNFIRKLKEQNIPTAIHYPIPLHKQPIFKSLHGGDNLINSQFIADRVVSLPMHPYLDTGAQDIIVDVVKQSI